MHTKTFFPAQIQLWRAWQTQPHMEVRDYHTAARPAKAPGQRKSAGQPKPILLPPEHTQLILPGVDFGYLTSSCPQIWGGRRGKGRNPGRYRTGRTDAFMGSYCSVCDPWPITKAMHFRTTLTLSINSGSSAVLPSSQSNIYKGFRRCKINLTLSV